jgi:hypothetical protein
MNMSFQWRPEIEALSISEKSGLEAATNGRFVDMKPLFHRRCEAGSGKLFRDHYREMKCG